MVDLSVAADLAAESFGDWTMVRADEAWARQSVPHEPTRRALTEVGLPLQAPLFDLSADFATAPLDMVEYHRRAPYPETLTAEFTAQYGRFVRLGFIPDLGAFLDPDTGQVHGFIGWDESYLLNSGVAEFVYFLAYIEKHRRLDGVLLAKLETRAGYDEAERICAHLATVDPAAFEDPDNVWTNWVGDGFAIGLFDDWAWHRASVDYFIEHGVNPTALEPRRPIDRTVAYPWSTGGGA